MEVYRGIEAVAPPSAGTVLVMGNFDGVHLGHQALMRLARERADARGLAAWGVTFDPHPSAVLAPDLAPPLISSLERRLERMAETGLDAAVVLRFTHAFATLAPEAFVDEYVLAMAPREIVVGYDFSFGHRGVGDPGLLEHLCAPHGVQVHVVPPVRIASGLVPSSSRIREYVLEGRLEAAEKLLGRPFEVEGRIVPGAGRGAGLGFATANLGHRADLVPKTGVYAVTVALEGEDALRPGAANVGTNPTFGERRSVGIEVHILGWTGGALHGRKMRVGFVERLRGEQRFSSVEALKGQIADDVAEAARILRDRGLDVPTAR